MAFSNPVLPTDCTMQNNSLPASFQEKGELDKFKEDREASYYEFVTALHSYWRRAHAEDSKEVPMREAKQGAGKNVIKEKRLMLTKSFTSFERGFRSFEEMHATRSFKPDRLQGLPCALYGTFPDVRKLKYQENEVLKLKFKQVQSSDYCAEGSDEKRICKYLDDNFPDSSKYVYHFPEIYVCETKKNDKCNISERLSCSKCLSHYSDQILRELTSLKLDEKSDKSTEVYVKSYLSRRNALKAVQNVCQRIELWCRGQSNIHMFIMANVNYKDYLQQYNHRQKPVTANEGDHDILLICQEIGIVFIQVKSCEEHSEEICQKRIKEAFRQLICDKFVFLESNRDLDFMTPAFPMWGFVALPNVSNNTLLNVPLCEGHRKVVLCKNNFDSMDWLKDIFKEYGCKRNSALIWTPQQFRFVCARYVGEGRTKGMQHLSKAIEETLKMFGTMIFTPEQNKILEKRDNRFQVITGDFGSGKSLLLCKHICNLLKTMHDSSRTNIYLLTCVGLDQWCRLSTQICKFPAIRQLEKYIEEIRNQQDVSDTEKSERRDNLKIMTLGRLFTEYYGTGINDKTTQITSEHFNNLFSYLMSENVSVFIDEMPLQLFKDCEKYIYSATNASKGQHVWVSIATQSCYGKLHRQAETLALNSSSQLVGSDFFHSNFLKENMRNSCSILRLMRSITAYTEEILPTEPESGHCIDGPLPLLCRIPRCCCRTMEPIHTIFCECLENRIKCTLQFVNSVVKGTKKCGMDVVYMVSHFYNDIFESSIFAKLKCVFDRLFKCLEKRYFWLTLADTESGQKFNGKYDDKELIVDEATFTGSESAIVIYIDLLSMWQWLPRITVGAGSVLVTSRCTSQYVHIVLQGNEPKVFIEEHIKMFQEKSDKSLDKSFQGECNRVINIMNDCLQNQGELLEHLLANGVMKEIYF